MGREWICRACNTGLGMFKDNPEALERAAAYLREHQAKIAAGGAVEWVKGQYRMAHPRA